MGKQVKIMTVLGLLVLYGSVWAQDSGLIAHWKFDEGSGTTAYDSAGDNDGAIYGAQWIASPIDGALSFDGVGDYVNCSNDISLDFTDAITIGAWVKRPNFGSDGLIAGKTNGDSRVAGYSLFSYTDGLEFNFYSGAWPWQRTTPRVTISANEWHHVVGTFDGNNAYLYVDGNESASLAYAGNITAATGYSFHISFWRPDLPVYFNGSIDEVVIYNRALSAEEVQQLYQSGLPDTVGLEITGPEQIREYSQARYKAIACYDNNATEEVTNTAQWSVEPTMAASINRGLLRTRRIETAGYLTIYGLYTLGETSGEAEMTVQVSAPVNLEITGPERVRENYTAQYKALIYYDDGQTMDVTNLALWRVEPNTIASINRGLLRTHRIDTAEYLTIYATYTAGGATIEEQITVQVSSLADLEIRGPERVRDNSQAQYSLIAYYDNGETAYVTGLALWEVEPDSVASIEAGLLRTEEIHQQQDITIYAAYTVGGATVQEQMTVEISVPLEIEIIGPECVRKNYQAQYKVLAYYDEGPIRDVTDLTLWEVEPNSVASIEAGLLRTKEIHQQQDITIYVAYTGLEIQMPVKVLVPPYIWYVPADYETIQAAINAAIDGHVIFVADGLYTGPGNRNIDFKGKPITVRSENGPANCIIDCQKAGRGFRFRNGEDGNSVLDGFTITNGYEAEGGGIFCEGSSPTVSNCTFSQNSAGRDGGGISNLNSSPTITNCTFSQNSAVGNDGGGMNNNNSNPTIANCTFSENSAYDWGGGMRNIYDSRPTISNCSFTANTAGGSGGGIYCYRSSPTISNCIIGGNSAGYRGGGIYYHRSSPTITNCTITGNSAEVNGGGIYCYRSDLTITNCIFWGNADRSGQGQPAQIYGGTPGVWFSCIQDDDPDDANVPFGTENFNIDDDPCFAFSTDYHIMPGSACIDAGDPDYLPEPNEADLEGKPRIIGGRIDMGAYEYNPDTSAIAISASTVSFPCILSHSEPVQQTLLIRNSGDKPLNWEIVADCGWLEVAPPNSVSTGEIDEITLTVEPNSLPSGHHNCILQVVGSNATNSPVTVQVFLYVPGTRYVPADYETIQEAIDAAECGDTVLVEDGIYTGPGNRNIDFLGKVITVRSENGPENCIIDCQRAGRGFYFHNSEDVNSVLDGFTITNGFSGSGIYCRDSSPMITNCIISGNLASSGGGIFCRESNPTIIDCTISGNSAYEGGGIYCGWSSSPVITNCTISGNSADRGGGIYGYGSLTITNCTFSRNTAKGTDRYRYGRGGGIFCSGGNLTVTNCIFSGNAAEGTDWPGTGGAIYSDRNTSSIINCTFAKNSAPNGNALACDSGDHSYPSNLQLTNCILTDGGNEIWNNDASTISITYSNVEGGWQGNGNIDADPCFALSTDYHLMPDSTCIDAGDPNYITEPNETDLEGKPRIIGSRIDMGAYEYEPNSPAIAISASAVSFYCVKDWSKPAPQTLLIRNCGTGTLGWEIIADCNWLQAAPANGVSTGQIDEITLTVDPNFLAPGYYSCILTVLDPNAANSPVKVRVTMPVGILLRVPSPDYPTIQAAIDAAVDYDMVLVADGTYTDHGNRNISFRGKAITVRSENGPNNCIIDCQGSYFGFDFSYHEDEDSVLDGFTITNGYHGIACWWESSPTITNCIISNNTGSGIYCDESSPTITNCVVSNNADSGIQCRWSGNPTITNCTIIGNSARYDGGGIYCGWYSSPTITNCTIKGNSSHGYGGGIFGYGNLTITNCNISENSAGRGGGIYGYGNLTIANSAITGNSAEEEGASGGGIFYVDQEDSGGTFKVSNCTITGNSARSGGGIESWGNWWYCWDANIMITNCTISGNSAELDGGGIRCYGNLTVTLANCTITGNKAGNDGGGIDSWGGWDASTMITNCILWGNEAQDGPQIYLESGSIAGVNYTDVQGGQDDVYLGEDCTLDWGLGNINSDPCFVVPGYWDANNFWVEGDYYLLPDSLCIDAGDPNYIPEPNETDIDGNPRVIDGRIDMGAYESSYIQAAMKFTPQTINCNSKGKYVKAHLTLPEGFLPEDVDVNEPAMAEPIGAESKSIRVLGVGTGPVRLEICFDREAFCDSVTETGEVEVTVIGSLTTSRYFYATDTIKIKPRR